jgi:hypothetical protein
MGINKYTIFMFGPKSKFTSVRPWLFMNDREAIAEGGQGSYDDSAP